jgi:hypothetical protein
MCLLAPWLTQLDKLGRPCFGKDGIRLLLLISTKYLDPFTYVRPLQTRSPSPPKQRARNVPKALLKQQMPSRGIWKAQSGARNGFIGRCVNHLPFRNGSD